MVAIWYRSGACKFYRPAHINLDHARIHRAAPFPPAAPCGTERPGGAEGSAGAKLKASAQRRCACVFMLRQDE